MLIDLRTKAEFEQGHLPGAQNIPHDEFIRRFRSGDLPDVPYRAHCNSGSRTALVRMSTSADIIDVQEFFDDERASGRLIRGKS